MKVLVNGKLAALTSKSRVLGLTSKQEAQMFERAYRALFPEADITLESEWELDE